MGRRGIDPREHEAAARTLSIPLSAQDVLDAAFRPRADQPMPFRAGRFGDGTMGVYYSALEAHTCEREVGFHLNLEIAQAHDAGFSRARRYTFVECEYRGTTAELRGKETVHPELVSQSEAGYPFCQALARKAVSNAIAGLLTRSARDPSGTCVPVFAREALGHAGVGHSVTAHPGPKGVVFRPA